MRRNGRRIQVWTCVAVVAFAAAIVLPVCASRAEAQAAATDLLAKLEFDDGRLGWDSIQLGMSLVQAERKLGVTLALNKGLTGRCPAFVASADRNGLTITVGFASPKPGAKVEWMRVGLEGQEMVASAAQLAAALRGKHTAAEWIRPADQPELAEADDYTPAYAIPGKAPQVVRFVPRESMVLALRTCFD